MLWYQLVILSYVGVDFCGRLGGFLIEHLLDNGQSCNRINDWSLAYESSNDCLFYCYYIILSPLILLSVQMLLFKDCHQKVSLP